jgi:chemotaxis protein histidine kinase CheA
MRSGSPVIASEKRPWEVVTGPVSTLAAALVVGLSPLAAPADDLQLADFESTALVSEGLKTAGMEGDLRMMKLWARLKAGALETDGRDAAAKVSEEKALANARMRVRSVQPYLDEAQRDIFAGRWKYVQGYLGVIFSQVDAFQTVTVETYPGNDPVSLASKDALLSEGNNIIKNAEALASAAKARSEPKALAAYAKLSLSYDRFLKAGDLYGNFYLLPSGSRPKPKATATATASAPPSEDVLAAKRAFMTASAKEVAAEKEADKAEADVDAREAAAKEAAAKAKAATKLADRAEEASEKADKVVVDAVAQRAAAEKAANLDATAKEKAAEKEAAAKAAAEAKEKAELEAEAAEAAAQKAAAEKAAALEAAESKLKAAMDREKAAETNVKLFEKAIEYEEKQEAAARKLADQKDTTSAIVPQYDPLTSTESLYSNTPQSALQYDTKVKPRIKDKIVVIAGPDKGKVGTLLGVEDGTSIIKLSTKELKVIDMEKIGKALQER